MFLPRESLVFLYTPMFLIGRTNKSHEEVHSVLSRVISTPVVVTRAYKIKLGSELIIKWMKEYK